MEFTELILVITVGIASISLVIHSKAISDLRITGAVLRDEQDELYRRLRELNRRLEELERGQGNH